MKIYSDKRIVLTLDAGGTNFVFSAIRGGEEVTVPIILPSSSNNLNQCLKNIINGFRKIIGKLKDEPVAISFAFPGPADYKNGIIGDLGNLPAFRGGVALGPMLEETFGLPTFINNDGDLFTYGEAIAGILPEINKELEQNGINKQYHNLFGITLGTGFGAGIIFNQQIYRGDNSAAGEIWLMRNFKDIHLTAEEGASIRAVQGFYANISQNHELLSPEEIYLVAIGEKTGDREAAIKALNEMSVAVGESLANAITLLDAPVVIGGGISGASALILPKILEHLNGTIKNKKGEQMPRLVSRFYDFEDKKSRDEFLKWDAEKVQVPFSEKWVNFESVKKLAVGLSRLGTSKAVSIGAYAFALNSMDRKETQNFGFMSSE